MKNKIILCPLNITKQTWDQIGMIQKKYGIDEIRSREDIFRLLRFLKVTLKAPAETVQYLSDLHGDREKFELIIKKTVALQRKLKSRFEHHRMASVKDLLEFLYYPAQKLKSLEKSVAGKIAFIEEATRYIDDTAYFIKGLSTKKTIREFGNLLSEYKTGYFIREIMYAENGEKTAEFKNAIYEAVRFGEKEDEFDVRHDINDLIADMLSIIRRLIIGTHVVMGDIADRGPDPKGIISLLKEQYNSGSNLVFEYGNHDALWMGAAAGNPLCILDVVRIAIRYSNREALMDYGIDIEPVRNFVKSVYSDTGSIPEDKLMQESLTILSDKLLGQYNRSFGVKTGYMMSTYIDKVFINGGKYYVDYKGDRLPLDKGSGLFPTLDVSDPFMLSPLESDLLNNLVSQFKNSSSFQEDWKFINEVGQMQKVLDGVLSFHAMVPVDEEGNLTEVTIGNEVYKGKALFNQLDQVVKDAFTGSNNESHDWFYWLWRDGHSPLFGKDEQKTFMRFFSTEKYTHTEFRAPFFRIIQDDSEIAQNMVSGVISDFQTSDQPPIEKVFFGHEPVNHNKQEKGVFVGGRVYKADGGFGEAYGDRGTIITSTSQGMYYTILPPRDEFMKTLQVNVEARSKHKGEDGQRKRKLVEETSLGYILKSVIRDVEAALRSMSN